MKDYKRLRFYYILLLSYVLKYHKIREKNSSTTNILIFIKSSIKEYKRVAFHRYQNSFCNDAIRCKSSFSIQDRNDTIHHKAQPTKEK